MQKSCMVVNDDTQKFCCCASFARRSISGRWFLFLAAPLGHLRRSSRRRCLRRLPQTVRHRRRDPGPVPSIEPVHRQAVFVARSNKSVDIRKVLPAEPIVQLVRRHIYAAGKLGLRLLHRLNCEAEIVPNGYF